MKVRALLLAGVLLTAVSAGAEIVSVDVYEWARTGTGVTSTGWEVFEIDEYQADKGVRFDRLSDYVLSPEYPGSVTQLVMTVKPSSTNVTRFLTAIPVVAVSGARNLPAAATKSYEMQTLVWRPEESVRRFRLQNATGSGTAGWGIRSLDVYVDRIEPPHDLRVVCAYADALSVAWQPDPRTAVTELELDRVITVPPTFTQLERWDFSVLTNATGNPLEFSKVPGAETLTGVSGKYLNVQPHSGGYLQAGNTVGAGKIRIDLTSSGERTALLRLYRSDASGTDGSVVVSSVTTGCTTNLVGEPFLTTRPNEFRVDLGVDDCALLIETAVKARRIRIEDARIVTDYVPGYATTNALPVRRTSRLECTMRELDSGDYIWRVRSFDAEGVGSAWSGFVNASLDPKSPRRPVPGFAISIK